MFSVAGGHWVVCRKPRISDSPNSYIVTFVHQRPYLEFGRDLGKWFLGQDSESLGSEDSGSCPRIRLSRSKLEICGLAKLEFLDKSGRWKYTQLEWTNATLTLARIEVNDFWDKILKAQSLRIRNLVPELIYINPNSRYDLWCTKVTI